MIIDTTDLSIFSIEELELTESILAYTIFINSQSDNNPQHPDLNLWKETLKIITAYIDENF